MLALILGLSACGGGGGSNSSNTNTQTGKWTWISGSNVSKAPDQTGVYGTKGTADSTNFPGARENSVSWVDTSGNFWLFGGIGFDSSGSNRELNGSQIYLNDLWKFDGTNWIWVSGSNLGNQAGVYGTQGTAAITNIPGARENSVSWVDAAGNFWLFGGFGSDSVGSGSFLNDLWKFDGSNWTWVSGSNRGDQASVYGTQGVAASTNIPGARYGSVSWVDTTGNFWLFGGTRLDFYGLPRAHNDLWKFDGTNWTWVSGSNLVNQAGVYGTQGMSTSANIPGARVNSMSWVDAAGNLWLFGGYGYDSTGTPGYLNDLWMFDGMNWTWVRGSNLVNQAGVYGTQGLAASTNLPGARVSSVSWVDTVGNFWLFGGYGEDSGGTLSYLNDLWKFDGKNWIWVSGSNLANQTGVYGTKGTAASTSIPGARSISASWTDTTGNLWLFGGFGYDSTGSFFDDLNDMWKYQP